MAGCGVFLYFGIFRFSTDLIGGTKWTMRFPAKEFTISLFFTIGVLGAAERFPLEDGKTLENLSLGISLFLLVFCNCLLIAFAERDFDQSHDLSSFYGNSTMTADNRLIPLLLGIVILIGVFLAAFLAAPGLGIAVVLSSVGLLLVFRSPLGVAFRPAFYDAVLLVPWLFVFL